MKSFKSILAIGITLVIFVFLILKINWQEASNHLKNINYFYFIHCTVVILAQFLLRIVRWHILLPSENFKSLKKDFSALFDAFNLGNFANFILPLRAGEIIRPGILAKRSTYSFSSSFVSIVIERFFDLSCVLLLLSISLKFIEGIPEKFQVGVYALGTLAVVLFIFILASIFLPKLLLQIADFFLKFLPLKIRTPLAEFSRDIVEGSKVLRQKKRLPLIVVLTLLLWFFSVLQFYYTLYLFPDINHSMKLALILTVFVGLAVAAPSAPGFLGVYEVGVIGAFLAFGLDENIATAYALISHIFQYVVILLLGFLSLFRTGMKFSEFSAK